MHKMIGYLAAATALLGAAQAQTIDQSQPLFDEDGTITAIGGSAEQKLAQTFTVGMDGDLTAIDIPVACAVGRLVVEIQGQTLSGEPDGIPLASALVDFIDINGPGTDFERIFLSRDLPVSVGDKLALVLSNPMGSCGLLDAPAGDTYSGGEFFFDARPNPPGWIDNKQFFATNPEIPLDIPFRTVMASGAVGGGTDRCTVITDNGPQVLPIPDSVPLFRCLEDAGAREFRCRLLHPDFFIARRIPSPFEPGRPFEEEWFFTPLTEITTPVEVLFSGAGLKEPVRHTFGKNSKVGSFETFSLKGMTPIDPKALRGTVTFKYENLTPNGPDQFIFDSSLPESIFDQWPDLMEQKKQ
ncbi:MAG: hypothetical protein AAGA69_02470 [Pseudomonadota bacterium]